MFVRRLSNGQHHEQAPHIRRIVILTNSPGTSSFRQRCRPCFPPARAVVLICGGLDEFHPVSTVIGDEWPEKEELLASMGNAVGGSLRG